MILSSVNAYLRQRKRASVADMALGLEATPDALKGMLAILERKGRVRRLPGGGGACGGCGKCDPNAVELYEWVGE